MGANMDKMLWNFDQALGGSVKNATALTDVLPAATGRDEL